MKTVKNVKNSLKFKVDPKDGLLSVRVGVKKYRLPVEARLASSDGYMFLSFSACSELFKIENGELVPMEPTANGTEAYDKLNPGRRRRGRRRAAAVEMPKSLQDALKEIPAGYKLVFDLKTGLPRLAKKRERRAKK